MNRKAYQQTLPKKRISAGCLFFDADGRLLIVNPTYKPPWEIPGGAVDSNESPLQACAREIKEELGLDWRPVRLLCVDYIQEADNRTESLAFIFLGGDLSPEAVAAIRLPAEELSECCFLEPQAALLRLGKRLRRRVQQALYAREQHTVFYLENQELVG